MKSMVIAGLVLSGVLMLGQRARAEGPVPPWRDFYVEGRGFGDGESDREAGRREALSRAQTLLDRQVEALRARCHHAGGVFHFRLTQNYCGEGDDRPGEWFAELGGLTSCERYWRGHR